MKEFTWSIVGSCAVALILSAYIAAFNYAFPPFVEWATEEYQIQLAKEKAEREAKQIAAQEAARKEEEKCEAEMYERLKALGMTFSRG